MSSQSLSEKARECLEEIDQQIRDMAETMQNIADANTRLDMSSLSRARLAVQRARAAACIARLRSARAALDAAAAARRARNALRRLRRGEESGAKRVKLDCCWAADPETLCRSYKRGRTMYTSSPKKLPEENHIPDTPKRLPENSSDRPAEPGQHSKSPKESSSFSRLKSLNEATAVILKNQKDASKRSEDAIKSIKEVSKVSKEDSGMKKDTITIKFATQITKESTKISKGCKRKSEDSEKSSQDPTKTSKDSTKKSKDSSKSTKDATKTSKDSSKSSKDSTKSSKDATKTSKDVTKKEKSKRSEEIIKSISPKKRSTRKTREAAKVQKELEQIKKSHLPDTTTTRREDRATTKSTRKTFSCSTKIINTGKSTIFLDSPPVRDDLTTENTGYYTSANAKDILGYVPKDLTVDSNNNEKENVCPNIQYQSAFHSEKVLYPFKMYKAIGYRNQNNTPQMTVKNSTINISNQVEQTGKQQVCNQQQTIFNQQQSVCQQQQFNSERRQIIYNQQILPELTGVASINQLDNVHENTTNRLFKEIMDNKLNHNIKTEAESISSITTVLIHGGWNI